MTSGHSNRRRRRDDESSIFSLSAIVKILIVFLLAVGVYVFYSTIPPEIDLNTFCPKKGKPTAATIILLDISDAPSDSQKVRFNSEMENISAISAKINTPLLQKGERLVVYSIKEQGEPEKLFDLCHPGTPEERTPVEEMHVGERLAIRRWEKFSKDIDKKVTSRLKNVSELSQSPILESIEIIRERHFSHLNPDSSAKNHKLVIWSDMVQHTDKTDHFKGLEDVKLVRGRYSIALTGVDIIIFYMRSEKYAEQQGNEHFYWWRKLFSLTGGTLKPPEKI